MRLTNVGVDEVAAEDRITAIERFTVGLRFAILIADCNACTTQLTAISRWPVYFKGRQ